MCTKFGETIDPKGSAGLFYVSNMLLRFETRRAQRSNVALFDSPVKIRWGRDGQKFRLNIG